MEKVVKYQYTVNYFRRLCIKQEAKEMKYEIIGQTVPAVEVTLSTGESMFTQSGGMIKPSVFIMTIL